MTDSSGFSPTRRKPKQIKVFFVIDMWGIEGPHGDGNWHELIHQFASDWVVRNPTQEPATLWSVVMPCEVFDNGTSCYMTSSSELSEMFFDQLAEFMAKHCGPHVKVLDVDAELPFGDIKGWRTYLHFEQAKLWERGDEGDWRVVSE